MLDWTGLLKIRIEGEIQYDRNFYLIKLNKESNEKIDSTRLVGIYGSTESSYIFPQELRNFKYIIKRDNPLIIDSLRDINFDIEEKTIYCNSCFGVASDKRKYSEYSNVRYTLNNVVYYSNFIDIKK